MLVNDFVPFKGQHCETTATGSLLKHVGLELSEPMLFGVGGSIVRATLKNVERARNAKGSMAAKNLSYTIARTTDMPNLAEAAIHAR